jgi:hypothetical protein
VVRVKSVDVGEQPSARVAFVGHALSWRQFTGVVRRVARAVQPNGVVRGEAGIGKRLVMSSQEPRPWAVTYKGLVLDFGTGEAATPSVVVGSLVGIPLAAIRRPPGSG